MNNMHGEKTMRKNIKLFVISAFSVCLLVVGCDSSVQPDLSEEEDSIQAGNFALHHVQSPSFSKHDAMALPSAQDANTFDLGSIGNTKDFFFVLINVGDTDIHNVTLETEHPGFDIYPKTIDTVKPVSDIGLYQMIRLSVIHGTAASGVGLAPVMEPGDQTTQLNISGTTTNSEGDSLTIELVADLSVDVKLADIRVSHVGGDVDLTSPSGSVMNSRIYSGWLRRYEIPGREITVENTGNVDLPITAYAFNYPSFVQILDIVLPPEESETLEWPFEFFGGGDTFSLHIDVGNIITDRERLPIQSDGKVYVALGAPVH